jgi:ATP-dependent Clp protease ATP-binding subunit ClpC
MSSMFERFTDRARRVVVLAQSEARLLQHNYIGTEHILLGLISEGQGVAAKALESLGVSFDAVRAEVEEIVGRGDESPAGHIPFTPRGKKVLELSLREALQLGHNYIGTEHILLGLMREGEGVGAKVLQKMDIDLDQVRLKVVDLLSGYGPLTITKPAKVGPVVQSSSDYIFTERSLRAISFAKSEASKRGKESIDVQDILTALTREENAVSRLLAEKGLTTDSINDLLIKEDPVDEIIEGTLSAEEIQDELKDESPPDEGESSAG